LVRNSTPPDPAYHAAEARRPPASFACKPAKGFARRRFFTWLGVLAKGIAQTSDHQDQCSDQEYCFARQVGRHLPGHT